MVWQVVADLKAKHGYDTVVMVGDGATDMEARDIGACSLVRLRLACLVPLTGRVASCHAAGGADAFIGFGGVAVRDKVCRESGCATLRFTTGDAVLTWPWLVAGEGRCGLVRLRFHRGDRGSEE